MLSGSRAGLEYLDVTTHGKQVSDDFRMSIMKGFKFIVFINGI